MKTSRRCLALNFSSFLSATVALLLGCAVFLTIALAAEPAPAAAANGFSAERLQRLDTVIQDYIARRQLAGAVVSIARDGQPVCQNSVVAVPPPAGSPSGVKYVTVPAKRPIQIHDLLTHTAGLTYGDGLAIDDYKKADLYGWGSAYYPQYLVDPQERMVALFMTQLMPDGGVDLVKKFKVLTYQALVK